MIPTLKELAAFYCNKKIVVTGGTGSIGENIVRSLIQYHPRQIIVFNRDDSKQYLMQKKYLLEKKISYYLGDIRDYQSVENVTKGADIVFHAAALKQVPICEENPYEAIRTNIVGCQHIIQAAIKNNVDTVINVSTDKAVNPTNTMGATKLIAEKLFKNANNLLENNKTRFASVRFGNVLGSRGSVIPLFLDQARTGQPITLTSPEMTRFFMTIPQAVELMLKAGFLCQGGEVFIFKMSAIRLEELIQAMKLYCQKKGWPIPTVKEVGVREGEKIYEELLSLHEQGFLAENKEMYLIPPSSDLSSYPGFQPSTTTSFRSDTTKLHSVEEILSIVEKLDTDKVR
ncbi:SDR family NAD(P)-dependent oxidoreductase [Caldalkalibacillus mannanilyticus]|uniref:SDR family NAD(P)-dependent oxidoreductase n=1 Tax=Caldalkalibacillus mannanilyticus TaxID=1418 RepID=UPI0005567891|nr:SDR family NAD(P)-dependent oxidoreductase [Caldalkalibacillus mannanilyticus]